MRKRIEQLEQATIEEPAQYIKQTLYPMWCEGRDVSSQLSRILAEYPEWRERPPGDVGRPAFIYWQEFTEGL